VEEKNTKLFLFILFFAWDFNKEKVYIILILRLQASFWAVNTKITLKN
jgi:hypothetical protein